MAYVAWSVVFGEQPAASKWNILGGNDASFADGTGIGAGTITAAKMLFGRVRQRQGGTTGDNSWHTAGTSNTDTSAKNVFFQAGMIAGSAGGPVTVTFPSAYSQVPIVVANSVTGSGQYTFPVIGSIAAANFTISVYAPAVNQLTTEQANWISVGQ